MMNHVKGEAFVLKKRKLLGQDIVLTLFSKEYGKVGVFGRGAGTLLSRRAPHLQTGNLIYFNARKKDAYWYLTETTLISAFSQTKKNEIKLDHKYMFLFMLDRLLAEGQKEERIYNLLKRFFIELSGTADFGSTHLELYLNELLKQLGYTKERKSRSEITQIMRELTHANLPVFSFS